MASSAAISPNYGVHAKFGPRIYFVNNEKLIDAKLFDLVECISRNNHIMEILLTPEILGPLKIGGARLKPF